MPPKRTVLAAIERVLYKKKPKQTKGKPTKKKPSVVRSSGKKKWLDELTVIKGSGAKKEIDLIAQVLAAKDKWSNEVKPGLPANLQQSLFWNSISAEEAKARVNALGPV